jgi:hypothetical protein
MDFFFVGMAYTSSLSAAAAHIHNIKWAFSAVQSQNTTSQGLLLATDVWNSTDIRPCVNQTVSFANRTSIRFLPSSAR